MLLSHKQTKFCMEPGSEYNLPEEHMWDFE